MKRQHRFETDREKALQEAIQITDLIVRLILSVQIFDWDIDAEEKRTSVCDRSDSAYPVLARAWAIRRDNLKATITELQRRLEKLEAGATVQTETA